MTIQLLSAVMLLLVAAGGAAATDPVSPSDQRPESHPGEPGPPSTMPTPPPSSIDPGIQKLPESVPDPKAAIPPPVVDPEMAIDPETRRRESEEVPPDQKPATPPGTPRR